MTGQPMPFLFDFISKQSECYNRQVFREACMTESSIEKVIAVQFTVDEETWVQSQRFLGVGGKQRQLLIGAVLTLRYLILPAGLISLIFIMKNDPKFTSENIKTYITVLVVYLALMSYQIYQWFFGYRNSYLTHPDLNNIHLSYEFHEDHFLYKTSASKSDITNRVPYTDLKAVYETSSYCFLISKKKIKFIITKKALEESDMNDLRQVLTQVMNGRYYNTK